MRLPFGLSRVNVGVNTVSGVRAVKGLRGLISTSFGGSYWIVEVVTGWKVKQARRGRPACPAGRRWGFRRGLRRPVVERIVGVGLAFHCISS